MSKYFLHSYPLFLNKSAVGGILLLLNDSTRMVEFLHAFIKLILHGLKANGKLVLNCPPLTGKPFSDDGLRQI